MFDLGWGELLVVGVVALVVLGPKELPNALRTVSNLTRTARKLAGEFQSGINEIVREAELEDARKAAQSISKSSISQAIEKVVDPTGEMKSTVADVQKDMKSISSDAPAGPVIPASPVIDPTPAKSSSLPSAPEPVQAEAPSDTVPAKAEAEVKA
jgi:sec-independent protein translocase protein TatB